MKPRLWKASCYVLKWTRRCPEICDLITPSGVAPRAAANAHEVRSGSKADVVQPECDVRFASNS